MKSSNFLRHLPHSGEPANIRVRVGVRVRVRVRAKAACEYAKEPNPELSTCYQSKVTTASSYVGKVLLVARKVKETE